MKKTYLFYFVSLMLIVSCSGVPKNNEQLTVSSEQAPTELAIAEPADTVELSDAAEPVSEPPVSAEAVAEEEKPSADYVDTLSLLDDGLEITEETELQPTDQPVIAMETLRPVETASPAGSMLPAQSASPVEPASPVESASPAKPGTPAETLPKTTTPALPERRTAQIVPPVRESWKQLPKEEETLATTQGSIVEDQEERILLPDYPITFSRTARVTVGQLVEIPFRGKDWVFIGEVGARRGIAYDSRKTDPEGDSFIFRVDASGTYALKFYRHDFAHDLILNDHVQIIAGRAPETTGLAWFNPTVDRSRVIAGPRWPNFLEQPPLVSQPVAAPPVTEQPLVSQPETASPVTAQPPLVSQPATTPPVTVKSPVEAVKPPTPAAPPARQPAKNETPRPQTLSGGAAVAQASPAQPQAPSQPSPPAATTGTAEPKSPDVILKEAREEFNAGRIASAITLLDEFCKSYPSGSDEAWWLYGQCYEANSPNRNMLAALEFYRRLVREYPMSTRLSDARRRVAYLERYYINIQ